MGDASSKALGSGGAGLLLRSHLFSVRQKPCVLACCAVVCLCCTACCAVLPGNFLDCAGKFLLSPGRIRVQTAATRFCVGRVHGWVPTLPVSQSQVESGRAFAVCSAGLPSRLLPVQSPESSVDEGSDNGPKFQGGVMQLARWRRRGMAGQTPHSQAGRSLTLFHSMPCNAMRAIGCHSPLSTRHPPLQNTYTCTAPPSPPRQPGRC